jgi:outer membrane biosynthesis protein TonB
VAVVEGITVCNLNELAKELRMAYLPGEKIMLELVQKGQDSHQGVGYLTDGTMVVVEHASAHIGQSIEIEFIRSLQTAAGKMMFAKKVGDAGTAPKQQRRGQQKPNGTKPAQNRTQNTQPQASQPQPQVVNEQQAQVQQPQPKEQQPQRQAAPQKQPQQNQSRPNNQKRRRAPSSNDRENSLIALLDKQE